VSYGLIQAALVDLESMAKFHPGVYLVMPMTLTNAGGLSNGASAEDVGNVIQQRRLTLSK
jgi:hypothetical protein